MKPIIYLRKYLILLVAMMLFGSALVGCSLDGSAESSSESSSETAPTLSEEEQAALTNMMKSYLDENLSDEFKEMIDEDGFGLFVGYYDDGWDISACVKERKDVIPATIELYEVLANKLSVGEMGSGNISVKYYVDKDNGDILIWKLTSGMGLGTLTDMNQVEAQKVREQVPYNEIELYVDKDTGRSIDVPIETTAETESETTAQ